MTVDKVHYQLARRLTTQVLGLAMLETCNQNRWSRAEQMKLLKPWSSKSLIHGVIEVPLQHHGHH